MNLAHVHLLLNHVPTVGTVIGLGLLLLSIVRNNDDLKRSALEVFFVIALLTLPTYLSGNAAEAAIRRLPDVSAARTQAHQDAAVLSLIFMEITGLVAWLGLWQYRRTARAGRWNLSAVLMLSVVTIALMGRTANIGGEIRHPEIRTGPEVTVAAGQSPDADFLKASAIQSFVVGRTWVWPASEAVHFVGLFLLFGVVLLVNLRMLGLMKSVPFSAFHRLLPWGVLGFTVNVITGMAFFIAAPNQYVDNVTFYWKMVAVMLAGLVLLYQTVFDDSWSVGAGQDAPVRAKLVAASAIVLWIGVIYCGQMLPFLGNAF